MLSGTWTSASAQKATTITTLAVTSAGQAVTTVASGSVVTLTASVRAGNMPVTRGQVNFCDASAKYCTDIHLPGTAQLTSAGTAILKLRPGIGSHSYKAAFLGTKSATASSSSAAALTVTGTIPQYSSTTSFARAGSWGNYDLTATVTETGGVAPLTGTVSFLDTSYGNALLGTGMLGASTAGLAWLNPQSPVVEEAPDSIVSGDFNGDGIPDVAVANHLSNSVTVLLGNGDGTFAPSALLGTGLYPYSIVVADFNGDGNLDLALANIGSDTLTILLGHGDGTFTVSTVTLSLGLYAVIPYSIAVGDFNSDGIPDLIVVTAYGTSSALLLQGNGDGTFTSAAINTIVGDFPDIVVGDFNGDGKDDLAVSVNGSVSILFGNGDGTFAAAGSFSSSAAVVAAADFNGDGKLDLVTEIGNNVEGGSASVAILLGNGDGTFTATSSSVIAGSAVGLVVGDFNNDGIPDMAAANFLNGGVTVLLGEGDGTFTANPVTPATGDSPAGLAVGDYNGDGRPDIVAANSFGDTLTVLITEPTETASTSATAITPMKIGNHLVDASYAGDSNYVGSVSGTMMLWGQPPSTTTVLAITSGGSPVTTVASGTAVTLTASVTVGANPLTTGQVNVCDASANVCTDIHLVGSASLTSNGTASFKFIPGPGSHRYKAILLQNAYGASSSSSASSLIVNVPTGLTFQTTTAIAQSGTIGNYILTATVTGIGSATAVPTGTVSFLDTSYGNAVLGMASLGSAAPGLTWLNAQTASTGTDPIASVTGDFNRDGKADLATLNQSIGTITILLGNGDGTFTPTSTSPSVGGQPTAIVAGDFNGDGILDLAVTNPNPNANGTGTVTVFWGNGDGTFTAAAKTASVVGDPDSMVAGDFNGDGILDLMVGSYDQAEVTILLGHGDGSFTQSTVGPVPSDFSHAMAVADLNGDHIPDVVIEDGLSNIEVLVGNGDGTFRTTPTISAGAVAQYPSVTLADFNQDGKLDLAVQNEFTAGLEVYLGNGDGTFASTPVTSVTQYSAAGMIVMGDFNEDGIPDLATPSNGYGNLISILLGKGDGSFAEVPQTFSSSGNYYVISSLGLADFNGDGRPDVAAVFSSNNTVQALLVEPTQTTTATVNGISPTGPGQHQVEASYPGDNNYDSSVSITTALSAQVATPVISLPSGTYTSIQKVSITDSTPSASIYYTTDGSTPPSSSAELYTGPITVQSHQATIQAIAVENGYQQSAIATATFTLNLPTPVAPVISLASGTYPTAQAVTISDASPNAVIYYTTNGSLPTLGSTQYTGRLTISSSETLVAVSADGYATSAPVSAQYLIGSSPTSLIYAVAGNGSFGYSGDGGPALLADLNAPAVSLLDSAGNLYILDSGNNVVRKVAVSTGVITTIAGSGTSGYSGDSGAATSAQLYYPAGMALDGKGNLYIADTGNNVVREVAVSTGIITTVAGSGTAGYSGDGGPATNAELDYPVFVSLDSAGNLFIADTSNDVIRKVNASSGTISTVAGNGEWGYRGDGGPAIAAELVQPRGLTFDIAGDLYIADTGNQVIREVNAATA